MENIEAEKRKGERERDEECMKKEEEGRKKERAQRMRYSRYGMSNVGCRTRQKTEMIHSTIAARGGRWLIPFSCKTY